MGDAGKQNGIFSDGSLDAVLIWRGELEQCREGMGVVYEAIGRDVKQTSLHLEMQLN